MSSGKPGPSTAKLGVGHGEDGGGGFVFYFNLERAYFPLQADQPVLETTVGGVLRERAAAAPQTLALIEATASGALGRRWTYAELLADSERLARALLSRFSPGERIAVWAPNIPEWVLLEYAAALAGLTLVTANPAYQPRELKYVLEQSRAVGLFLVAAFRGNPMARIAAEVAADLPALRELTDMEDWGRLFAGEDPARPLPDVRPRTRRRSSTPREPPAFRRARCCIIAASPTMRDSPF